MHCDHRHSKCYCGAVFGFTEETTLEELVIAWAEHVRENEHIWFDRLKEGGIKAD